MDEGETNETNDICFSTNEEYPINDFMQPGSYAYALSHNQKSLQVFPPFNSINGVEGNESKQTRPYIQHFARLNTPVSAIRAFPFGDNFAIGTINTIYIASNKLEPTFNLPQNESTIVKNIDVHPSSIFLACDGPTDHNTIRIVSLQSHTQVMELNKHKKEVSSILFLPSVSKVLSTSFDGSLIISDLIKKHECFKFDKYEDKNAITTSSIKSDEAIISIAFDNGSVGIFDHRESSGMISLKNSHSMWVNSLCFAPVKSYMATNSIDKSLRVWDLRYLDEPLFRKDNLDTNLSKVIFLNDSVLAGASTKGELIQWDFNNSTVLRFDKVREFGLFEMDIQRESNRIVVSSEDTVVSMFYYYLSY
ncbi:RING finger and WD repeat domain-containing protein 2 [Tritrichomonas musculus]|uniref:RING finger and WD repeat domain-containing protein 2 n=1 Tax=Tritrichomonas musculus TaxID=1915356 RepID=A0ABR2L084_9EUKA